MHSVCLFVCLFALRNVCVCLLLVKQNCVSTKILCFWVLAESEHMVSFSLDTVISQCDFVKRKSNQPWITIHSLSLSERRKWPVYVYHLKNWTAISCFPIQDRKVVKQIDSFIYICTRNRLFAVSCHNVCNDSPCSMCTIHAKHRILNGLNTFLGNQTQAAIEFGLRKCAQNSPMKVIEWMVFLFHVYGAFFCDVVNIDWYTNHSNLKAKNLAIFSCYISMQTLQCNNEIWEQQPKQQETSKENTYLNVAWIDVKFLWCFCKIWWFCYVLMHTNARWRMERMTFIWNDRIPVRWTTANNMICAHITRVYNFCGPIWLVLIDLFWFFYMNSRRIWCFSFCCPISLLQCKNPSWVCLTYNTQTHTHIYIYIFVFTLKHLI